MKNASNEFEQLHPSKLEQACGGFLGLKPLNDDDITWLKWFAGGTVAGLGYLAAHKRMHTQASLAKAAVQAAAKVAK